MLKLLLAICYFGKTNQPPLGGCVLKHSQQHAYRYRWDQPPLGGCVLKPSCPLSGWLVRRQPPLGGCVLKRSSRQRAAGQRPQPPLGGCVLKLVLIDDGFKAAVPAAFRRLCVETGDVLCGQRRRLSSRL